MAEPDTTPAGSGGLQPASAPSASTRRSAFVSIGAVLSAFLASLCCIGPILFVTLGVGAGLATRFEPLRPLFTVITLGVLAVGFYVVYGRHRKLTPYDLDTSAGASARGSACDVDGGCIQPQNRTRDQIILWIGTALALVLLTFPEWSKLLV